MLRKLVIFSKGHNGHAGATQSWDFLHRMVARCALCASLCLFASNFVATAAPISFPAGFVPFSSIYYIAGPDANGNRLVEGTLTDFVPGFGYFYGFSGVESITPGAPGQQFSDALIQLAPGQWFSNVYVPTAAELEGNFQAVSFPIFDPLSGNPVTGQGRSPFAGNVIPKDRLLDVFAFEIGPAGMAAPEPNAGAMLALAGALLGAGIGARRSGRDLGGAYASGSDSEM
jgi:hypothetical protein